MWGTHGELFSESGKLRDWSRAGYAAGDRPIPKPGSFSDLVVDWNADGDGLTDDTQVCNSTIYQYYNDAIMEGLHVIDLTMARNKQGNTTLLGKKEDSMSPTSWPKLRCGLARCICNLLVPVGLLLFSWHLANYVACADTHPFTSRC